MRRQHRQQRQLKEPRRKHSLLRDPPVSTIKDLLNRLDALSEVEAGPFPYDGCRWLRVAADYRHDGLVPDLDGYLSEFAGYRSWGKKILEWPDEKIATVEKRLSRSFFERFPAYTELKPLLGSYEASDVRRTLHNAEQTREALLQLFSAIRRERTGN
jgi:hypothetical protein